MNCSFIAHTCFGLNKPLSTLRHRCHALYQVRHLYCLNKPYCLKKCSVFFRACHRSDRHHKDIPDKTLFLTVSCYQGARLIYWWCTCRARGVKFGSRDDRWSRSSIMSPVRPASSDHLHTNSVSQQRWMRPCGERHGIQTPLRRLRREGWIYTRLNRHTYAGSGISQVAPCCKSLRDVYIDCIRSPELWKSNTWGLFWIMMMMMKVSLESVETLTERISVVLSVTGSFCVVLLPPDFTHLSSASRSFNSLLFLALAGERGGFPPIAYQARADVWWISAREKLISDITGRRALGLCHVLLSQIKISQVPIVPLAAKGRLVSGWFSFNARL